MYNCHAAGSVTGKRLNVSGAPLGSNTAILEADYTYNGDGNIASMQYPFSQWSNGSVTSGGMQYSFGYDSMARPSNMINSGNQYVVSSVNYGAANQVLQLNATAFTETRTYNTNLQLTELVSGTSLHLKYNFSATQNNGRIQSQMDVISGETVAYTYDSLNRLINASGSGDPSGSWSQAFTYDGFGNLSQKSGSNAPNNLFLATNPGNNRLTANGAGYDSNGNLSAYGTGSYAVSYSYDIENRMTSAIPGGTTQTIFGYDQSNQRIYQGTYNTSTAVYSNEQIYFYGADGRKLAVYSLSTSGGNPTLSETQTKIWFAGRIVTPRDRLQSQGKYFPYGEDRYSPSPANPSNDAEKFATYTRDSGTGLDYAYQRYYAIGLGRFVKADPYAGSVQFRDPQSWNHYAYSLGDPADLNDPEGLCSAGIDFCVTGTSEDNAEGALSILGLSASWSAAQEKAIPHGGSTATPTVNCNQLTLNVGLAGLTNAKALQIWNDGGLAKSSNGATLAALAAVTWAGESSFSDNPSNNYNAPGSVDIGPFQINTLAFPAAGTAVYGTNRGDGQTFNGNVDANITFGIGVLRSLFSSKGTNAAEYYIVGPYGKPNSDSNAVNRQNTYNKYQSALKQLFSNTQCFH